MLSCLTHASDGDVVDVLCALSLVVLRPSNTSNKQTKKSAPRLLVGVFLWFFGTLGRKCSNRKAHSRESQASFPQLFFYHRHRWQASPPLIPFYASCFGVEWRVMECVKDVKRGCACGSLPCFVDLILPCWFVWVCVCVCVCVVW